MKPLSMFGCVLAFAAGAAFAQQKEVTIAYQDMLEPYRASQEGSKQRSSATAVCVARAISFKFRRYACCPSRI